MALYIRFHIGQNIKMEQTLGFLRHLLRHLRGPVVLLWDSSPVHKGAVVKEFIKKTLRLRVYHFPGYAPELNPDEFVWAQLKRSLANSVPKDIKHLRKLLQSPDHPPENCTT